MQKKRKLPIYAVLSIAFLIFCSTGFLLAPNDPKALTLEAKLLSPCMSYPFGTDELGRCIFSRILMGGYVTLGMALCSAAIVAVAGTAAGLLLGHAGSGKRVVVDSAINAATAIPPIAYLVIFIGIWGNSIPTMMVALTASLILRMVKLVKTLTEIEMGKAYIMCMVSSGATKNGILFAHVLPNIAGEIVHFLCLSCAEMIVGISAFSFIGFTLRSYELVTPYEFPSGHSMSGWSHLTYDIRKEVSLWHRSSKEKRTIPLFTITRTRTVRPGRSGRPEPPTRTL